MRDADPAGVRRCARGAALPRSGSPTRKSNDAVRAAAHPRQHRVDRRPARAVRAVRALVRHAQPAVPRCTSRSRRRICRRPRSDTSRTPGWCRRRCRRTPLPASDPGAARRCAHASPRGARPRLVQSDRACARCVPQLNVKLQFKVGSAHDPKGKEGLAALAASMIAEAGSTAMRIDEIQKALYPDGGELRRAGRQGDDDVHRASSTGTTGTRSRHRAAACSLEPGFREEDFTRLKDAQLNALVAGPAASNNEEELGKERLQNELFAARRTATRCSARSAGSSRSRSTT